MGRARDTRRRLSAAVLLSGLARRRKIELRLARKLEEPFLRVLDAARRSTQAIENFEAFLRRVNAVLEEQRGPLSQVVRESGEASAQRGYDRTIKDLRRLGQDAEGRLVSEAVKDEIRRRLDDETHRRLDPLPDRLLKSVEFLRSNRALRPWAKKLARGLAKAASTYAEVRGELAANEGQGTGWWEWVNVGDDRVRRTHRRKPVGVGGEVRQVSVLFSNGCRYPRDPLADISETANCRCRTRPALPPTGGPAGGGSGFGGGSGGGVGSGDDEPGFDEITPWILEQWDKATFDGVERNVRYHWRRHGMMEGKSVTDYTSDAIRLWDERRASAVLHTLQSGGLGWRILDPDGPVGTYTGDGKVVAFRYYS